MRRLCLRACRRICREHHTQRCAWDPPRPQSQRDPLTDFNTPHTTGCRRQTALQEAQGPLCSPPRETLRHKAHMGPPPRHHRRLPIPLCDQPDREQPSQPLHLPILQAPRLQRRRAPPLWQGSLGHRLRGLLHRRPVLHPRIHHAGAPAPAGQEGRA